MNKTDWHRVQLYISIRCSLSLLSKEAVITHFYFIVFGLTRSGIDPRSTASVAERRFIHSTTDQLMLTIFINQILNYTRCITLKCVTSGRVIAPVGNTAPFEDMFQRWRAVGYTVSDLTAPRFQPQTSRSKRRTRNHSTNRPILLKPKKQIALICYHQLKTDICLSLLPIKRYSLAKLKLGIFLGS